GACQGFSAQDFSHDPGCRYNDGCQGCSFEQDPLLGRFAPLFCDISRRCAASTWRFDASAVYLHRADPESVALLTDPTNGGVLLNSSDMEYPWRVGPRLQFVVTDCAGLGLELNYFSVDGWSSSRDFTTADFPSGFATLDVDSVISNYPVTDAHVSFSSEL